LSGLFSKIHSKHGGYTHWVHLRFLVPRRRNADF
jgi:hypothetical protein